MALDRKRRALEARLRKLRDAATNGTLVQIIDKAGTAGQQSVIRVSSVSGRSIVVPNSVFARWASEQTSMKIIATAIASNPEQAPPELVRSLQAEDNWWRRIEAEFGSLSSTETAQLLGASPKNRNYASSRRAAGQLLGFTRKNSARFPKFQFDLARGSILEVIPEVIGIARNHGINDEDVILWMVGRSTWFAGQDRPVDHLDNREMLLAAARDEFGAAW